MADYVDRGFKRVGITISKPMLAIVCIVLGIMVILLPNLLVWIVGLFLIIQGALLLTSYLQQERPRTTMTKTKGVYCYSCGAGNTDEAIYCKRCGKELVQTGQVITAEPKEATQ